MARALHRPTGAYARSMPLPALLPLPVPTSGQLEVSRGLDTLFCCFYDNQLGTCTVEPVDLSKARKIKSFYGEKALAVPDDGNENISPQAAMFQLDQAMAILRIRYVAAKLVVESSFNLSLGYKRATDWLQLLKLVTSAHGPYGPFG